MRTSLSILFSQFMNEKATAIHTVCTITYVYMLYMHMKIVHLRQRNSFYVYFCVLQYFRHFIKLMYAI